MNQPRETIYNALFTLLQAQLGSTFQTISRRWRMPQNIAPEVRPAIFQVQTGERAKTNPSGIPLIWISDVDLVVYTQGSGDDDNFIPSQELNALLDRIEIALAPVTPGERQTLGGKVFNCKLIKEKVRIVENVSGSMALAVFPVEIYTNA